MQKITPFLWFDNNAEEAMEFYCSIFKDSRIGSISRYGDAGPGPKGSLMVGTMYLNGQEFMVLNGGPVFKFTEAVSFLINCDDQEEVDHYWEKLSEGGSKSQCGWLKDKFGLSWQVVPVILGKLMSDKNREKAGRAAQAMMKMTKIEIDVLQRAFDGQ